LDRARLTEPVVEESQRRGTIRSSACRSPRRPGTAVRTGSVRSWSRSPKPTNRRASRPST